MNVGLNCSIDQRYLASQSAQPIRGGAGAAESKPFSADSAHANQQANAAAEDRTGRAATASSSGSRVSNELSPQELEQISKLVQRDREVRNHEAAHVAAGGGYVRGAARFDYQAGPDGKRYAIGGEVSLDTSKVAGDPRATLEKARTIQRAAMAPADPSAQDHNVAAQAMQMATEASMELAKSNRADGQDATASTGRRLSDRISASGAREDRRPGQFLNLQA